MPFLVTQKNGSSTTFMVRRKFTSLVMAILIRALRQIFRQRIFSTCSLEVDSHLVSEQYDNGIFSIYLKTVKNLRTENQPWLMPG